MPLIARIVAAESFNLRGRGFDVIYVHDSPSLYVYGVVARLVKATLVCHVHLRGSPLLEEIRTKFSHSSIHISNHSAADEPYVIIRNPVWAPPIRREPRPDELVVAGSISGRKNQLLAIDALAVLLGRGFNGRLRLCGDIVDADYFRQARRRAKDLMAEERISYEGFVPPQDYLTTASCLLMPSLAENQPLALLEAIAAEVPVVASDIPAHRELVDLGCLPREALAPLTPEAFANAVLYARKMRHTSKYAARVREIFSAEKFSTELAAFFRTIESQRMSH